MENKILNDGYPDVKISLFENKEFKVSGSQLFQYNSGNWDTYLDDNGWSLVFYNPYGKIIDQFRKEINSTEEIYTALNSGEKEKLRIKRISTN